MVLPHAKSLKCQVYLLQVTKLFVIYAFIRYSILMSGKILDQ